MTNIDEPWPAQDLESVSSCPVCKQSQRTIMYEDLQDHIFRAAEGRWSMYKCINCKCAYLDPRPTQESIARAYLNYYTHEKIESISRSERKNNIKNIFRALKNGYVNNRYKLRKKQLPEIKVGTWLIPLLPPVRSAADCIFRHIPQCGGSTPKLLDIGCGNGSYLLLAQQTGWEVEGLDFDADAVRTCREAGLNVRLGGIEILDGFKNNYDVITLSHVIEHVYDPILLLNNIYSLLKPGGMIWLATPNIQSLLSKKYGVDWRGLEPPRHLVLFNRDALYASLQQAKFVAIKQHYDMATRFIMAQSDGIKARLPDIPQLKSYDQFSLKTLWVELAEIVMPARREYLVFTATKPLTLC